MTKHFDKQFKLDAIQYYHDHKILGLIGCASNLEISQQSLSRWQKELRKSRDLECRRSGNYSSDEAKEIARLKRKLCDTEDALNVQKNHRHSGRVTYERDRNQSPMGKAIYNYNPEF